MSRYANTFRTSLTPAEAQEAVNRYLQGEGFNYLQERGEMVWRKGVGALANPQFLKVEVGADGTVHLEAWTAGVSLIPGVYGGEMDPMHGVFGAGPKMALKPRIRELEKLLGASGPGTSIESPNAPQQPTAQQPAANWFPDPTGKHERRYWDGTTWTAHVADAGATSEDPL